MSILATAAKPKPRPPIITITGEPGVGKTTLANQFPGPVIFMRFEDGLEAIPEDQRPDAFPLIKKVEQAWEQLTALVNEDHDYKTLVIDSVTQAETLFGEYVVDSDPKNPKSLAQAGGGYGAGYLQVAAMHGRIRKAAQILNERKGMTVIFLAHTESTTVDLPDSDPYSRYELRMHKKSVPAYSDNVDMVAYLRLETFTTGGGEKKKAISSGQRIAICHTDAAQVSKNRYGIKAPVHVNEGENPFVPFIKYFNQNKTTGE